MNKERINDLAKRALHRIVARALARSDVPLLEARKVVTDWKRERGHPSFVEEWERILRLPRDQVRREILRMTPEMTRLRLSSPFFGALPPMSDDERRRLWRAAHRVASAH